MTDFTKQHFLKTGTNSDGMFRFIVYHYDKSGNEEISIRNSEFEFDSREEAIDSAVEWCDSNGIDAEME